MTELKVMKIYPDKLSQCQQLQSSSDLRENVILTNFGATIWWKNMVPKYAQEWGGTGGTPLEWICLLLGRKLYQRLDMGCGCGSWERGTPVGHIYQHKNMFVPPFCWGGGSATEVVELNWRVTVSRELVCPAGLHPRCGVVDICPSSCLKVGH